MKLPNGFGSVYKLKGNLRRPWVARKTVGWNEKGQPKYIFIGYFPTRKEALDELSKYNAKPYDKRTTFGECEALWWDRNEDTFSYSNLKCHRVSRMRCEPLRKMKMADIRLGDLQTIVDGLTEGTAKHLKVYLSKIFEYAVQNEILPLERHSIIKYINLPTDKGNTVKRQIFTPQEISETTDPLTLILLYTGMRIGELLELEEEDIHLDERWLYVKKSKTEAGVRIVPIAERIVPCFDCLPTSITYKQFAYKLKKENGHLPHDARHTFISRMADLGVDERITKAIVGHAGSGVTETVYTHLDLSVLLEAVNRL